MPRKLKIRSSKQPAIVINRVAFRDKKLVYVARANKKLKYPWGRSRISYIGTTKRGAHRVASSAVWKGADLLFQYGIKHLELNVVTCQKIPGVESWRKLERALLIRFREIYGEIPRANNAGKKMKWKKEKKYFPERQLEKVIEGLS